MMKYSSWCSVVGLLIAAGCGSRAHIMVTRPAMLDASSAGNTYQVLGLSGSDGAAAQIQRGLEQRITRSLNPSIRLVRGGAGLVIDGEVVDQRFDERMERNDTTCQRQERTGTNAQGQATYRTVSYACAYLRRVGEANVAVRLRVAQSNGTAVFDQTYRRADSISSTGMESPYANEQQHPPELDGAGLLARLNEEITAEFARVILPWQDEVVVAYEGCGDDRCGRGFELVRASDLAGAERLFSEVIGEYESPTSTVPENLRDRISEALYNRGVTRGYMGRFAPALADLSRACTLRPGHDSWRRELANIQRLSQEQESLRSQGVIREQTQDVASAGAP